MKQIRPGQNRMEQRGQSRIQQSNIEEDSTVVCKTPEQVWTEESATE